MRPPDRAARDARDFPGAARTAGQLFDNGSVSNRQLQLTSLVGCAWCGFLALRTRTGALSTVFAALALVVTLSVIAIALLLVSGWLGGKLVFIGGVGVEGDR